MNKNVLKIFAHLLWISFVVSLSIVLCAYLFSHQTITVFLIGKCFLITAIILYTIYASWMLTVWLFSHGWLFLICAILFCVLGALVLILLGIFHAYNTQYVHVVVISGVMIVVGIFMIWQRWASRRKNQKQEMHAMH